MKRFGVLLMILYALPAFAAPGRLGGYSLSRREKPETTAFNNRPAPPPPRPWPHYLNEDGSCARTGVRRGEDKYTFPPVYSTQQLYDMRAEITQ